MRKRGGGIFHAPIRIKRNPLPSQHGEQLLLAVARDDAVLALIRGGADEPLAVADRTYLLHFLRCEIAEPEPLEFAFL